MMVRPKQKSEQRFPRKSGEDTTSDSPIMTDGETLEERVKKLENLLSQERLLLKQVLSESDQEVIAPLHTIMGMLNLLLETDLTQEQREFAESARYTGTHLIDVINQRIEKLKQGLTSSSGSIPGSGSSPHLPSLSASSSALTGISSHPPTFPVKEEIPSDSPLPGSTSPEFTSPESFMGTSTPATSASDTKAPSSSPDVISSQDVQFPEGGRSLIFSPPADQATSSPTALAAKDSEGVKKRLLHFSGEISPAGVSAIWRAFLHAVPSYLDQLEKALLAGDGVSVNGLAYTLSRACLNLGAEGIVEWCRRLENLKIAGREADAWHLFKEIKKSFERLTTLSVPDGRHSPPSKPSGDI